MFTDDDEPQGILTFLARLSASFGGVALALTCFFWLAMLFLGGVDNSYIPEFCKEFVLISLIPGAFLVTALLLDFRRDHSFVPENWMTRAMLELPVLSRYPHPLRWVIGLELGLWFFFFADNGLAALLIHRH